MWMPSQYFSLAILYLPYWETSYIVSIPAPWRKEVLSCVVSPYSLSGSLHTYLNQHWRMSKDWHGPKGWCLSPTLIFVGVRDPWKMSLSLTAVGSSLTYLCFVLGGYHLKPLLSSLTVWVCPKRRSSRDAHPRSGVRLRQRRPRLSPKVYTNLENGEQGGQQNSGTQKLYPPRALP